MNMIINICDKKIVIVDLKIVKAIGFIDRDYGLIRYLIKILSNYTISVNKQGYLQIENRVSGESLVHKIILEYYSKFNVKLYTILTNPDYEVNHKNKNVADNRLENLELVTKKGNMLHKNNKEYKDEIVMTTEELINIREKLKEVDKYRIDTRYIEKANRNNYKLLDGTGNYKELFDNLYLKFNNNKIKSLNIASNIMESSNLAIFNSCIFSYSKSNILYKYFRKLNHAIFEYDIYRATNIINQNEKIFIKNYNHKYFKLLCAKYNIFDINYLNLTQEEIEHINNKKRKRNVHAIMDNKISLEKSHNFLLYLFKLLPRPLRCTFYKNNLIVSVSIRDISLSYSQYSPLKILYYLDLLQRIDTNNKQKYINSLPKLKKEQYLDQQLYKPTHKPNIFIIPRYTKETFFHINEKSKVFYEQNLSKITHFIAQQNLNEQTADKIYKSNKCKANTQRSIATQQDIHNILSTTLKQELDTFGFITKQQILKELEKLNEERRLQGQPFNIISTQCINFVSSTFRNVEPTKQFLKESGLEYISLSKAIIQNIKKHQKKNKADKTIRFACKK